MQFVRPLLSLVVLFAAVATGFAQGNSLEDQVVAAERAGLDALKAGDYKKFADLTRDDAVFVDDHGPATKAEVMSHVADFKLLDYEMSDVRFVGISRQSGLIAYHMKEHGSSHGHEFRAEVYVSSVWTQTHGKWQCQFSQETGVAKHG